MTAELTDIEATRRRIGSRLRAVLPEDGVVTDVERLRPFECDALSAYRQPPLAVAMPTTVAEVQAVLAECRAAGIPVVTRGAGTGLSGGALPLAHGVLLNMSRMNRILEIDAANRLARVQPGVRNLQISEAVAPLGLYYAPIHPHRSPAASAATSPRTRAASTA